MPAWRFNNQWKKRCLILEKEGNKHLHQAKNSESARKQAEKKFREAEEHFAKAYDEAKSDNEKTEIDGYRAQCGARIHD